MNNWKAFSTAGIHRLQSTSVCSALLQLKFSLTKLYVKLSRYCYVKVATKSPIQLSTPGLFPYRAANRLSLPSAPDFVLQKHQSFCICSCKAEHAEARAAPHQHGHLKRKFPSFLGDSTSSLPSSEQQTHKTHQPLTHMAQQEQCSSCPPHLGICLKTVCFQTQVSISSVKPPKSKQQTTLRQGNSTQFS